MARKVFISVLGTGFYEECVYTKCHFESTSTRFIQEATMEWLGVKEWSKDSVSYILLTDKAECTNWNIPENKRINARTKEVVPYKGLKQVLENYGTVEPLHIPDGKDEKEMWQIFTTVFSKIQYGDELYFDLTHSFRYLPMLILVLGNYAKFLRGVKLMSITYGNYEARNPVTNRAPIIDLLPLAVLQDWTIAAADFVMNGNVKQLSALSNAKLNPLMRESKGKDEQAKMLKGYVKALADFLDDIKLCRGIEIYNGEKFSKLSKLCPSDGSFIVPLNPVIDNISSSLSGFTATENVFNMFAAARWSFEKEQYQAAVTELQEGIVTFFCMRHGIAIYNEKEREIVNKAFVKRLSMNPKNTVYYLYSGDSDFEEKVDRVAADGCMQDNELVNDFAELTKIRNDMNHSGMRKGNPLKPDNLKNKIGLYISRMEKYLSCDEHPTAVVHDKKPALLLNFTNHPYRTWSDEQKKAAKKYGECRDMCFPEIDPMSTEKEVEEMADNSFRQILMLADDYDLTVHIMGEMTFTFLVVSKLLPRGIRCISSTTYRIVEELPDGSKRVVFNFKRFREYGR